uniref:Kinase n=1 Tax=Angiostrongylus cantonensis TaxID=6313 RepID=A0A158PAE9_ANGCA
MEVPQQELPDAYEWFAEQVAGHHPSIIKNGKREIGKLFYLSHRDLSYGWPDIQIEDVEGLAVLTPRFYGIISLAIDREDHDFLILEDVTAVYRLPAILDVKMGRVTFDPLANALKQERETTKYPPQRTLGFRLLGYRMHCSDGTVVVKDKEWGKAHNENTILNGLREFFSGRGADPYLISEALLKLDRVRQWFSTQRSFHFYSSSLLFVYENDLSRPSNLQLVMIDFSHVFPANDELDTNYIHGLDVFQSKMQAIHNEFASKQELQCS